MITIFDALTLAAMVGLAVLLWNERSRLEHLEEENDELWDNLSIMMDDLEYLMEKDNAPTEQE